MQLSKINKYSVLQSKTQTRHGGTHCQEMLGRLKSHFEPSSATHRDPNLAVPESKIHTKLVFRS